MDQSQGGQAVNSNDKAAAAWNDYINQQQEEKVEELEREIIRLNCRINRIESMYAAKDDQICNLLEICRANGIEISSQDLINGRLDK